MFFIPVFVRTRALAVSLGIFLGSFPTANAQTDSKLVLDPRILEPQTLNCNLALLSPDMRHFVGLDLLEAIGSPLAWGRRLSFTMIKSYYDWKKSEQPKGDWYNTENIASKLSETLINDKVFLDIVNQLETFSKNIYQNYESREGSFTKSDYQMFALKLKSAILESGPESPLYAAVLQAMRTYAEAPLFEIFSYEKHFKAAQHSKILKRSLVAGASVTALTYFGVKSFFPETSIILPDWLSALGSGSIIGTGFTLISLRTQRSPTPPNQLAHLEEYFKSLPASSYRNSRQFVRFKPPLSFFSNQISTLTDASLVFRIMAESFLAISTLGSNSIREIEDYTVVLATANFKAKLPKPARMEQKIPSRSRRVLRDIQRLLNKISRLRQELQEKNHQASDIKQRLESLSVEYPIFSDQPPINLIPGREPIFEIKRSEIIAQLDAVVSVTQNRLNTGIFENLEPYLKRFSELKNRQPTTIKQWQVLERDVEGLFAEVTKTISMHYPIQSSAQAHVLN